jgi:hypothetical protein
MELYKTATPPHTHTHTRARARTHKRLHDVVLKQRDNFTFSIINVCYNKGDEEFEVPLISFEFSSTTRPEVHLDHFLSPRKLEAWTGRELDIDRQTQLTQREASQFLNNFLLFSTQISCRQLSHTCYLRYYIVLKYLIYYVSGFQFILIEGLLKQYQYSYLLNNVQYD